MAGQKRTISGQLKAPNELQDPAADDTAMAGATPPPCAQPDLPPSKSATQTAPSKSQTRPTNLPHSKPPSTLQPRRKMAKLPPNTSLTKRPLIHPALPTPFSSSASPKVLYITASTPFIPCLKRIRKLLTQVDARAKQSTASRARGPRRRGYALEASGRLEARDVEGGVVEGVSGGGGGGGEQVYLKATGRAIPRALEVGVRFQEEGEFRVRVEMGRVCAVDDVEVRRRKGGGEEEEVAGGDEQDVPETRIRMLSSITVSIGPK